MCKHQGKVQLLRLGLALLLVGLMQVDGGARADRFQIGGNPLSISWCEDTTQFGIGNSDVLLMSVNESQSFGNTWGTVWDGNANQPEYAGHVCQDYAGNLYHVGFYGLYFADIGNAYWYPGMCFVQKRTLTGTLLWNYNYNWSNSSLVPNDITTDAQGNIYVAASAVTGRSDDSQWMSFTFKLNANGEVQWARRWSLGYRNFRTQVAVEGSTIWVAVEESKLDTSRLCLLAYDAASGTLLNNYCTTTGELYLTDLETSPLGGVLLAGFVVVRQYPDPYHSSLSLSDGDVVLGRFSLGGGCAWLQSWGTGYDERPGDLSVGPDGRASIIGSQVRRYYPPVGGVVNGDPDYDLLLLEYSAEGPLDDASVIQEVPGGSYKESGLGIGLTPGGLFGLGQLDPSECFDGGGAPFVQAAGESLILNNAAETLTGVEDADCLLSRFDIGLWQETWPLNNTGIYDHLVDSGRALFEIVPRNNPAPPNPPAP